MKTCGILFALTLTACASMGIDREGVREVVRDHLPEIKLCYDAARERNPKIKGKLTMNWEVDDQGRASKVEADPSRSSLSDERVITCISDAIKTWNFPKAPQGTTAEIHYPINFSSPENIAPADLPPP
jgi:hypothetical protein